MRVIVNLTDHKLIEVGKQPLIGDEWWSNGRYVLATPEHINLDIKEGDVVKNLSTPFYDTNTIVGKSYAELLASYPMYNHIVFNPLLMDADMTDFDLTSIVTFEDPDGNVFTGNTRAQIGRYPGSQAGYSPISCALLPQNPHVTPPRAGLLLTNTIDISFQTDGEGATEFMVWWKIYEINCSHDINSSYGYLEGTNQPAMRTMKEIEQEPNEWDVALSVDDGTTFHKVGRLEPISFCDPGTKIRLLFVNNNPYKMYLASYAIMF